MKGYPLGLPVTSSVYILHLYAYIYRTHCSLCLFYRPPTPKFLTWNICILFHFQNTIKIWTFSWSALYSCILSYTLCSVLRNWAHSVVFIQLQVRVPNLSNKKFGISGASDCSFFAVQNNKKCYQIQQFKCQCFILFIGIFCLGACCLKTCVSSDM